MKLPPIPFQTTNWLDIPTTVHPGDAGQALWHTKQYGELRMRLVEYSPGYVANHWCQKGHVLYCLEGELQTELADGRTFYLRPGMTYEVGDGMEAHRSSTTTGARLFIVD